MTTSNLQIKLARRPDGLVKPDDFTHETEQLAEPADGQVLVRVKALSLDPAMRGWLNDVRSYVPPVAIGEVMRALGVGEVVRSNDPKLSPGDKVSGMLGWQQYAVCNGRELTPVDESLAPLQTHLSVLGMTGMTAYFGLLDVGVPKQGETILVSAAAGAVGSVVGQLARIKGCRVVGIAGGPEKCKSVVDEFGFDACIDYKADEPMGKAIRRTCPDGVNVYFDNVGGDILNATLPRLARGGRVVICGAISAYNATQPVPGPSNYLSLLVSRGRMEGFVVFDYANRYPEAVKELAGYLKEGKLVAKEHVVDGLEHAVEALNMLFSGKNTGKLVLQVH